VHVVPAGKHGLDELCPGEPLKHPAGLTVAPGQAGQGVPVEAGTRMPPSQSQPSHRIRVQLPARPVEQRAQRCPRDGDAVGQAELPPQFHQFDGQVDEPGVRPGDGDASRQPERQRKPRALLGEHPRRHRVVVNPAADHRAEQPDGFRQRKRP
jgi:hypothetical protein